MLFSFQTRGETVKNRLHPVAPGAERWRKVLTYLQECLIYYCLYIHDLLCARIFSIQHIVYREQFRVAPPEGPKDMGRTADVSVAG